MKNVLVLSCYCDYRVHHVYNILMFRSMLFVKKYYCIKNKNKSWYVDVALLYSRLQVGQCIKDSIKLEFNDIISLYKINDSERRRFISLDSLNVYYLL